MAILTAKQMRKLAKEKKEQEKAAERERIKNATANPVVIQEIIEKIAASDSALKRKAFLIYETYNIDDRDWRFINEIGKNFEAYYLEFRKLGYKLRSTYDGEGCGYWIYW